MSNPSRIPGKVVISSDAMETLNLTLPTSWSELTQPQLRSVFVLMTRFADHQDSWWYVTTSFIRRWCGIKIVSPYGRNWLIRVNGKEYVMDSAEFTQVCRSMEWLKDIPESPVRLDRIDGAEAMAPDPTYDLTLEQWLACDNLYQGYQFTQDPALLHSMAAILYRKEDICLTPSEEISIFYWWASVKQMVSGMFPNFFQPAPVTDQDIPDADQVRRSVDAQIRALTKGDITKEEQIFSLRAIRALPELDARAKRYQHLNKKYPHAPNP